MGFFRGVPTKEDLIKSAQGICSNDEVISGKMFDAIHVLTQGYQAVHAQQNREYFGLRDFYSVVKMAFEVAKATNSEPEEAELKHVVQRNFGGYFGDFDPSEVFLEESNIPLQEDEKRSSIELILDALRSAKIDTR